MAHLLVLALTLNIYHFRAGQAGPVNGKTERGVPPGFAYPESPIKVELKDPIRTKLLGGTITDADGFLLSDVLVERVGEDWATRLDAGFTDSDGVFRLAKVLTGTHFLKLSKPGYDTLLVRVVTTKKARHRLKLRLNFST
jgi:hypothetical protein